jgi:hypothetical protein
MSMQDVRTNGQALSGLFGIDDQIRKGLADSGVQSGAAPASMPSAQPNLLGLQMPTTWQEKEQSQGGMKYFGKQILNELTGGFLEGMIFPDSVGADEQYKLDKALYAKALENQTAQSAAGTERGRLAAIDRSLIDAFRTEGTEDDALATAAFLRDGGTAETLNIHRRNAGLNKLDASDMTFKDYNNNYRKDTQGFADFQDQYTTLQDSLASDSGVGDLGLVFGLAKLFDPRSVVREGEVTTLQSTAGLPAQVMNMYKEVKEGRKLAPSQRSQIQDYADRAYINRIDKYDQTRDRYIERGSSKDGFGFANLATRLDDRALYRDQLDDITARLEKAGMTEVEAAKAATTLVDEAMSQFNPLQQPTAQDPSNYILRTSGNR